MRKLRIHITPAVAHVDYDLPEDWDDLGSYQQYRIIRDLGDRAIGEAVSTYGEAAEVAAPTGGEN